MKPIQLVYVVLYDDEVLTVCSSRSVARAYCKKAVVELDFFVDKFRILELPVVKKIDYENKR